MTPKEAAEQWPRRQPVTDEEVEDIVEHIDRVVYLCSDCLWACKLASDAMVRLGLPALPPALTRHLEVFEDMLDEICQEVEKTLKETEENE